MFSADCQYSSFSYAGSFSPASATRRKTIARLSFFFFVAAVRLFPFLIWPKSAIFVGYKTIGKIILKITGYEMFERN